MEVVSNFLKFVRFFERKAAEGRNDNSDDEIGFGSPVSGIPSAQHSPNSAVVIILNFIFSRNSNHAGTKCSGIARERDKAATSWNESNEGKRTRRQYRPVCI